MQTLYIDISSDKVYLSCNDEELFLERNGIEDVLGKALVERYRKYNFTKAYILNGPGGFTNLRVGSLCMNLLNALVREQIDFYSVSKIQLYEYGWKRKLVKQYGIIYIGQKRNIRLWDFEKNKKIGPTLFSGAPQMNFEQLEQEINLSRRDGSLNRPNDEGTNNERTNNLFLDVVYDQNYYPDFLKNFTPVQYDMLKQLMNEYIETVKPQPTKHIEANYMIDPIITPKSSC